MSKFVAVVFVCACFAALGSVIPQSASSAGPTGV